MSGLMGAEVSRSHRLSRLDFGELDFGDAIVLNPSHCDHILVCDGVEIKTYLCLGQKQYFQLLDKC